ncbi:MAG: Hpt domain-containing protein [Phycisphaerales bacterium]
MFDEEALLEQVDGDVEFLADTVEMLAADGPELVNELRAAIGSADAAAVGRVAHALKGMISNFCAPAVQEVALELERAGKAGDLSGAPALIDRLAEQVDALIAELNAFVQARA